MLKSIKFGFIIWAIILSPAGLLLAREGNSGLGMRDSLVVKSQHVGNNICPVTGEIIDEKEKVTYEYKGKIYNLCCSGCIEEIKNNPEKYIQKIEKEMDNIKSSVEKNQ